MFVYVLVVFLFVFIFGSLSDYFGCCLIFIISLLGLSIGYLIFGLGNLIWMLFFGCIIEGLIVGEIFILYVYFVDIMEFNERIKVFGWMGVLVGIGIMFGFIISGLLVELGNFVFIFIGVFFIFLNVVYGYIFM